MRAGRTALVLLALVPWHGSAQAPAADRVVAPDTIPRIWIPYAIGTLSAKELGDAIGTSLLGGLRGRMAGVRVMQPSGEPGSPLRLRLRGATDISGPQDPLVIIDGSIIRGSHADIAADDVERIEVLKGPSASAIYGSDGAAGVILVFTRRGHGAPEGKVEVQVRNEAGPSFMTRRFGESGAHPFEITPGPGGAVDFVRTTNGSRILKSDRIADNPYPGYRDHQSQLYRTGLFLANHLSIAGRKGGTNFAASFDNTRAEGTVFALSGFRRRNLRLNLNQRLGPVDLALSGFYGWSDRDMPQEGLGPFFAVRFLEPHVDLLAPNPDGSPYRAVIPDRLGNSSNPLYALANLKTTAEGKRLIGGGRLRWRAMGGLAIEGSHHIDREDIDSSSTLPAGFLSSTPSTPPSSGFVRQGFFAGRSSNTGAAIVVTRGWNGVRNTSRIGYAYEKRTVDDSVSSRVLSNPDPVSASTLHLESNVKSAYGATAFILNDRYILDAAARRDELSFLPPETRRRWYYRIGGAWRANEDLRIEALDELRLHAAYGTAGTRPELSLGFFAMATGVEPLRAPHSGELELGASLVSRGGRFTLEYAYSRKQTRDVIEIGSIQTPVGFIDVPLNAGTVQASTQELTLGYAVLRTPHLVWNLTLTGDRIRQELAEYSLPRRLMGFGSQQPAIFFIGAGTPLGVLYGSRFVRTIAELYDDPDKKALSGPGQAFDPANFSVNEEGYLVSRASWRCGEDLLYRDGTGACSSPERPILYEADDSRQLVPIGNATPDFVLGLQSTLRYKNVGFSALFDWSQGGDIYNGSRQWPFQGHRDPVFDQSGKPEVERKSIEYYRAFFSGLEGNALFVESATYLKVRELAMTYEFRLGGIDRVRLGLVGRNLFTFTGYSGYDPEVGDPADPFLGRIDWFQYPRFRTISAMVEITF